MIDLSSRPIFYRTLFAGSGAINILTLSVYLAFVSLGWLACRFLTTFPKQQRSFFFSDIIVFIKRKISISIYNDTILEPINKILLSYSVRHSQTVDLTLTTLGSHQLSIQCLFRKWIPPVADGVPFSLVFLE